MLRLVCRGSASRLEVMMLETLSSVGVTLKNLNGLRLPED